MSARFTCASHPFAWFRFVCEIRARFKGTESHVIMPARMALADHSRYFKDLFLYTILTAGTRQNDSDLQM